MFDPYRVGPYRQNYYYQRKGQVIRKKIPSNTTKHYSIAELKKLVPLMYKNGLIPPPKPLSPEEEEEEDTPEPPQPPPGPEIQWIGLAVNLYVEGFDGTPSLLGFTKGMLFSDYQKQTVTLDKDSILSTGMSYSSREDMVTYTSILVSGLCYKPSSISDDPMDGQVYIWYYLIGWYQNDVLDTWSFPVTLKFEVNIPVDTDYLYTTTFVPPDSIPSVKTTKPLIALNKPEGATIEYPHFSGMQLQEGKGTIVEYQSSSGPIPFDIATNQTRTSLMHGSLRNFPVSIFFK